MDGLKSALCGSFQTCRTLQPVWNKLRPFFFCLQRRWTSTKGSTSAFPPASSSTETESETVSCTAWSTTKWSRSSTPSGPCRTTTCKTTAVRTLHTESKRSPLASLHLVQAQTKRGGGEEADQLQVLRSPRWKGVQPVARHHHRHWGHSTRVVSLNSFIRLFASRPVRHSIWRLTLPLQVWFLHREPGRQQRQRLTDALQRCVRHQWVEAWSHAATHLQAVSHVLQLAGEWISLSLSVGWSELLIWWLTVGRRSLLWYREPSECPLPASTPTNWPFWWVRASTGNQMWSWTTCCSTSKLWFTSCLFCCLSFCCSVYVTRKNRLFSFHSLLLCVQCSSGAP